MDGRSSQQDCRCLRLGPQNPGGPTRGRTCRASFAWRDRPFFRKMSFTRERIAPSLRPVAAAISCTLMPCANGTGETDSPSPAGPRGSLTGPALRASHHRRAAGALHCERWQDAAQKFLKFVIIMGRAGERRPFLWSRRSSLAARKVGSWLGRTCRSCATLHPGQALQRSCRIDTPAPHGYVAWSRRATGLRCAWGNRKAPGSFPCSPPPSA